MLFASYALLLLAAAALGLLIYRYDLYEKEPWYMLLLAAALGAAVGWLLGPLEDVTLGALGSFGNSTAGLAAVAASHEEVSKLLVVAAIAMAFRRQFNDPLDGIIYGAFAGLGLGLQEGVGYLQLPRTEMLLPGGELIRLCMHTLTGGIDGFALGPARMRRRSWPAWLVVCLALSACIHFLWNLVVLEPAEGPSVAARLAAIALMLGTVLAFGWLVITGARWSRAAWAPGSPRRLWGWPFSRPSARND